MIATKNRVTVWLGHIPGSNDKIKFGHTNINDERTAL